MDRLKDFDITTDYYHLSEVLNEKKPTVKEVQRITLVEKKFAVE
jgi:hypothetical protein